MIVRKFLTAAALSGLMVGSVFAQATQPATPATPARPVPSAPAPAAPARPATPAPATAQPAKPATPAAAPAAAAKPAAAPAAQGQRVNLNTATAAEMDGLPQIGEARAKAIIEARAKGRFKDWNDFVARNVVPKNAEDAIKDRVRF
ncbi:MAG: ComEA family DNA-binding protein [Beijerinckiaceae bacterium]